MKIRLSLIFVILSVFFLSCSNGISQKGEGSITLDAGRVARYLGQNLSKNRSVSRTIRHTSGSDFDNFMVYKMSIKVSTLGNFETSVQKDFSKSIVNADSEEEYCAALQSFFDTSVGTPISIENIPVGSKIKIKVALTFGEEIDEDAFRELYSQMSDDEYSEMMEHMHERLGTFSETVEGYSDEFVVKSGSNNVTIRLDGSKFYAGEDENGVFNFPIVIWNNLAEEKILTFQEGANGKNVMATPSPNLYTEGVQAFTSLTAGMEITNPNLPSDIYCFGDDCIYAINLTKSANQVESATIEKYIISSNTYIKDFSFDEIEITDLINQSGYNDYSIVTSIGALAYCINGAEEYIFFSFTQKESDSTFNYRTCYSAINLNSPDSLYLNNAITNSSVKVRGMSAGVVGSRTVLCYVENKKLVIQHISSFDDVSGYMLGEDGGIDSVVSETINLDSTNLGISRANVGDIQIVGNYLYIAFYQYMASDASFKVIFDTEDESTEPNGRAFAVSNGGIAKIDLTSAVHSFISWSNGEKLLGWYRGNYYQFTNSSRNLVQDETMQPPLSEKDNYFYGARKFIAKKPDELVIADDGAYVEARSTSGTDPAMSEESIYSLNMNRIVTVNLLEESISSVIEVNASFDVTMNAGTAFGVYAD